MDAKVSVFVICVESIIYVLLHNWNVCTFNTGSFRGGVLSHVQKHTQKHLEV